MRKIKKNDKPLVRFTRKRRQKAQVSNNRNKRGAPLRKRMLRGWQEQTSVSELDNLDALNAFLERHTLPFLPLRKNLILTKWDM